MVAEPKPRRSRAGVAHLAVRATSVEKHVPHTPTQLRLARSLARTTRTRNETETDFLVGDRQIDYSPQPPIHAIKSARILLNDRQI